MNINKIIRTAFRHTNWNRLYSSSAFFKVGKDDNIGSLLISCKRKNYDHYGGYYYDKLDEVPLASKGWRHSKSKGDVFTVYPLPGECEEPLCSFEEMNLHSSLIKALQNEGIMKATNFQQRAMQSLKAGSHTLLAAETGCGKTIAYMLPIIQHIVENNCKSESLNSPQVLVVVPNRELAYQIGDVAKIFGASLGIKVKVIVGGRIKKQMMNPFFEPIDVLVGTPGAIGKLSSVGIYRLHEVKHLVLDEADTLLDDSFINRMGGILNRANQSQVILVAATVPRILPDILASVESGLQHVVSLKVHKPLLNVTQKFMRITASSKPAHLLQIAKASKYPMLIFANKNQTCNWIALFLRENGVSCANINGDMNCAIRIDQWNQFVCGDVKILAATDVGSRGLNTVQVQHVLNYDFPIHVCDYLHRIGRVGRLGSPLSCKVTNLITGELEIKLVQQIELAIRRNQAIPNVDGNITNIVQRRIARSTSETA